jgi:hypothetical protein
MQGVALGLCACTGWVAMLAVHLCMWHVYCHACCASLHAACSKCTASDLINAASLITGMFHVWLYGVALPLETTVDCA